MFLPFPPKHSRLHSYRLILSLSIRATTGPGINKQGPWSEQHRCQEMKTSETSEETLPWRPWMCPAPPEKPHPELVSLNLIRTTRPQSSSWKQQALPWWPMPENQTKVTEEEVGEGVTTCSWRSELQQPFLWAFQSQVLAKHSLYPLKDQYSSVLYSHSQKREVAK